MATTTNYGWTTPDDTALVKDGASAIRTLGSSVDTTTKNLNPSTTLGDLQYRSATANTNTRLGIGTTGQVLSVVGGVPAWATAASSTPTFVGASLFKSANQTITNNTLTLVTFNSENFDTNTFHDTVTNNSRITIPAGKGGYYQFNVGVEFAAATTGQRSASLLKNGVFTTYSMVPADVNANNKITFSYIASAVATDYFELSVYQDSGSDKTVVGATEYTFFQAFQIGV